MKCPNRGDWVEYPAWWSTPAIAKQRSICLVTAVYGLEVIAEVMSPANQRGRVITDHFANFLIWEQPRLL